MWNYILVQTSKIYTTDLFVKINTRKLRYEHSYSHYVKKDFYWYFICYMCICVCACVWICDSVYITCIRFVFAKIRSI